MNQILVTKLSKKKVKNRKEANFIKPRKTNISVYLTLMLICLVGATAAFTVYIYGNFERMEQEKISKSLSEVYNISTLYSNNNEYSLSTGNSEIQNKFLVVGIIKIDRIKISYPIISNINDDYLKISPCRFYGPLPNEVGNLCIAAHNYDDNRFFSRIGKLTSGDLITIYDNSGKYKYYSVYNVYETKIDDISCTNQETNMTRELTLVTCNNLNGNRIIVKAREVK